MKGYRVPSTGVYLEGSGSGDAGMKIWKPVMQKYFQQIPRTSFNQPPRKIQVGEQVRVPNLSGLGVAAATRKLERLGFTVEKTYVYSDRVPKYGFMGWSPGSGDWISEFGTIYAVYSSGRDPAVVAQEKAEGQKEGRAKEEAAADRLSPVPRRRCRRSSRHAASGPPALCSRYSWLRAPLGWTCRTAPRGQPDSWRLTSAATTLPSALPLVCGVTCAMTLPIPFMPSSAAPVEAMASATMVAISASVNCCGR